MRIIGGQAKGRRIAVPSGCAVRPTSDRIKEALFNILGPLEGLNVLDLYAGTGNVGMEALSRGAAGVVFVEKTSRVALSIRENLHAFGFAERSEVIVMDVEKALGRLVQQNLCFDLIFADPPYRKGLIDKIIRLLNDYPSLLTEEGRLVIQHSAAEPLKITEGMAIELADDRRYGDTLLSFCRLSRH